MGKLQKAVLIRTVVPIMLMGIVIALFTGSRYKKMLYEQMKPMLSAAASSVMTVYDELYEGDYTLVGDGAFSLYKGEQELTGDFAVLDRISAQTGVEITLFYKDARILTTLKDTEGERYVTTGVNSVIYRAMEKDPQVRFYNVEIDGVEYYACYAPIMNFDGSLAGMVGVARKTEQISEAVRRTLEPIWLIILCCALLAGYISVNYTKGLVDSIRHIRDFLQRMTRGKLNHTMTGGILKREDEIGDVGRTVVAMQKAMRILVELDPLTALYNRQYGTIQLKNIRRQSELKGVPYAVAMGDIDGFKKVGDTFGHVAGDSVLTQVAKQLKLAVAGKGAVCRWTGDKFLIVYDGLAREEALKELTQMLQHIRSIVIPCQGQEIRVTMTFGLADSSLSDDYEALIRMANDRLEYGKEHGRDRIVSGAEDEAGTLDVREMENIREMLSEDGYDLAEMSKDLHRLGSGEVAEALELFPKQDDLSEQNRIVEEIARIIAENVILGEAEEDAGEGSEPEETKLPEGLPEETKLPEGAGESAEEKKLSEGSRNERVGDAGTFKKSKKQD